MPLNRAFLDLCNLNAPPTKSFKSLFTVSFYLFIYLFICLFIYLFIYLFVYLFIYLFIEKQTKSEEKKRRLLPRDDALDKANR